MDALRTVLVVVALLGSGLVAGVFFAFSGFVMRGLDRAGPEPAAAAMRGVNAAAVRPPLMLALFGTALLAIVLGVLALVSWAPSSPWLLAAGVVYLLGAVVVTAAVNVPLNDRLAASAGGTIWPEFLRRWTGWNHARTLASLAAAAGYAIALLAG